LDGRVTDIYADGGLWIAGGWHPEHGPAAWTSGDAETWVPAEVENQQPDETFAGPQLGPVVRFGDSLLSFGTFIGCCDGRGVYGWRSADGRSWEAIESSSPLFEQGYFVQDIAAGDAALVAAENQFAMYAGRIWTWTESTSWVETSPARDGASSGMTLADVVWSHGRFVVVGARGSSEGGFVPDGASWVSTDGAIWEESAANPAMAGLVLSTIAALPEGGFVALAHPEAPGSSGLSTMPFTSRDGLDWSQSEPFGEAATGYGSVLVEVSGGIIAFSGQAIRWTADGSDWTEVGTFDGVLVAAAVAGNDIVVVTSDVDDATTAIQRGTFAP
jgi:hypothetical protein